MQRLAYQRLRFAEFTLDLTRGCLLHFQQEIKLRPKSFEVLKYLVENNERLISKDELITAVWLDTAVTDSSLVQCLKDIRHALHDETQQIIKTVHGRGYIFDRKVTNGPTSAAVTTYREDTEGVQIIIEEEEETNGHGSPGPTHWIPAGGAKAIANHEVTGVERFTQVVWRHKWIAVAASSVIAMAAVIISFPRPATAIESVAVMPFVNVSGDPNTEYLSDGLSDRIINDLSQLPNLKVISLNSVLRYKGKQIDPKAVGRELRVGAVLMGRLTRQGDDLSISAELIDVRDNSRLWGSQYSRNLVDMMSVQMEIAQEISEKLRLRLSGDMKQRLTKRDTESGEAYRLFLLGSHYFRRKGKESLEKSIEYFEQAIKKDPNYAPAYAGLGETYRNLGWGGFLPAKEARQKEEWATLKALGIDDALAEAHVLNANIREIDLDWPGAEGEYRRALELDPNSVRTHQTYAWHLEIHARLEEAMLHLKRAEELDPLALEVSNDIATLFVFLRQYDKAIEQHQKTIEMDPNFFPAHIRLANAYQHKLMYEEALGELKKVNAGGAQLAYAYAVAEKRDEAKKLLNDLVRLSKEQYVSPMDFAIVYIGLGDKDQAIEWLNKTFDENPYRLSFIKVNPRFDSLRSDPRFTDLLRRMKLVT
jgi:TolB-like protein/DNA-binding winged helix-turn-helix (wHTH) protein/Tfp pilus assembly protein PilF